MSENCIGDVSEAARAYSRAGWAPLPLLPKTKKPFDSQWGTTNFVQANLETHFGGGVNIGLKCGTPSDGLVDIDIDDARALKIAGRFLPPTTLRHGRPGNRNSHWWYRVTDELGTTAQFRDLRRQDDGAAKSMIIEYRSTGAQTAVPPSIHPSGEQLRWEEFGKAADVDGHALMNSVRHVAAATLIARHWPAVGGRNDAAMALSGALLRGGMDDAAVERFVRAVAEAANDDEADDRIKAVAASREKIDAESPVTGFPSLSKLIGEDVARQAFVWLTEAGAIRPVTEWDEPIFFTENAVPQIPGSLLPQPLGDFARALAAEFEVPEALCVVATLGTAATAVSNKVVIELKPNWQEPLNLYLAAALPPGSNKTAVLNRCTRPLLDWEASERVVAEPAIQKAQSLRRSEQQHIESERRKAAKEKNIATRNTMFANIAQLESQLTDPPAYPRLFANDLTPEALALALQEQGGRFAVISDEGGITETLAGLYSDGAANVDVLLKGIDGGYVRINRKSGDPIELQPYLSLVLAVQPAILQNMGRKRAYQGNGLLERFLFTVPKSNLGFRTLQGISVPAQVEVEYRSCVNKLLGITQVTPERSPTPHVLKLSDQAQHVFAKFRLEIEGLMKPGEKLHEISGWAGKLPGFTARIAGLMHVAVHVVSNLVVDDKTMQGAIDLARLLIDHAVAARHLMGCDQAADDAKRVFEWIKSARVERMTRTECLAANRFIATSKRMEQMLAVLADHNIIGEAQRPESSRRGRPPNEYQVNPRVHSH